jgi:hypothetical protein
VKDLKSGQLSRPVNWKIEVMSFNKSSQAPRCPPGSSQRECLPYISEVKQDGLVEIKFPFKLRSVAKELQDEYYRNMTKDLKFELKIQ